MKKSVLKRGLALALGCMLITGMTGCSTSKEYPSKDIQFYISADAGGGTDGITRKVTQIIEANTDAKFYMVNKPGVNDAVAASLCMDAKADGYTICNVNYGSTVTAVYNQVIENYSMDRLKPIALVTEESDAIMVRKGAPFTTFEEMIEYAKANPGQVKVADQGIGSRVYLLITKLEEKYGVEFNKISYSSSAPQREAMLSSEVDVAVTSLGDFTSLLTTGDATGICEFSSVRNAAYPDVPTCIELGMEESFLSGSFIFIAAPAETPDEIVQYLQDAFQQAVESDEFKEWTATVGVTPHYLSAADLKQFIADLQEKDFKALDELKAQGLLQ
ncbi:MAG: tripartite tricarboxylate transporter substrate binding protein [Lachnospiraceae bacterium]|nr:tripartite tricarboxylate transporter substrate binding protein [Lachnospiraceae bacterium]